MPSVDLVHARTSQRDPATAAEEICTAFGSAKPKLVTVFASRDRDQRALNKALRERLPSDTRLLGATTGGEIDREGMHEGTIVAAALFGDLEVALGLGKGLSTNATAAGETAIARACDQLGVKADALSSRKYGALVIDDGFRFKKEEMLLGVMPRTRP